MEKRDRWTGAQGRATRSRQLDRVDVQVSIFTGVVVILSCLLVFFFSYRLTYENMIQNLVDRAHPLMNY